MGREMRRGRRCYYRKVREGGKVRSVYCGSGERGEAAAREDAARKGLTAEASGGRGRGAARRRWGGDQTPSARSTPASPPAPGPAEAGAG